MAVGSLITAHHTVRDHVKSTFTKVKLYQHLNPNTRNQVWD